MNPKKKILFIITKSNWGGAQRYVFDIANGMKDQYDVAVAAGGNGILLEKLKSIGIKTTSIPWLERDIRLWNEPKAIRSIFGIISTEKPDIIHLHSPKGVFLGSIAGRIWNVIHPKKVKIIQTVHGFPFTEPRSFEWRVLMWIASYASTLLCQINIFVSKKDLELSRHMPFTKRRNIYIPNGIGHIALLEKEEARLKLLRTRYDGFLAGTIAELNHNKGIEFLIHSFTCLKDKNIRCVVLGDGEDRENLEKLKEEEGAPIDFLGYVSDASKYLKAFDIFILPSLKEGLPYVLLEAGFAGIPTISTSVGGIPYLIESGISGTLVPPKNPKALAQAIESYMRAPELRHLHAKSLKEKVETDFSIESTLQRISKLYER